MKIDYLALLGFRLRKNWSPVRKVISIVTAVAVAAVAVGILIFMFVDVEIGLPLWIWASLVAVVGLWINLGYQWHERPRSTTLR